MSGSKQMPDFSRVAKIEVKEELIHENEKCEEAKFEQMKGENDSAGYKPSELGEIEIKEDIIHENEKCEEAKFKKMKEDYESDGYEPSEDESKELEYIPLEYKIKCIDLAKAHPNWSLKTLRSKGCHRLKSKKYLSRWEEEIKKGGNRRDKCLAINSRVYDRFVEARKNDQQVTTQHLQQWALEAAAQYKNFKFKASHSWVVRFKQHYKIRYRQDTKLVSEKEIE